jgi:cbb3-type cytochrome oxidase maturation protein
MESFYLLIPIVVVFAIVAVVIYIWAVNSGQYDDLEREGQQVLFDEEPVTPPSLRDTSPAKQERLDNHD